MIFLRRIRKPDKNYPWKFYANLFVLHLERQVTGDALTIYMTNGCDEPSYAKGCQNNGKKASRKLNLMSANLLVEEQSEGVTVHKGYTCLMEF